MNHLNTHTLLLKSQHCFTKGKSCLTNLLSFLEDFTKAIDEGKPFDVIYLDFSKAFDKVPHKRLLHKIEFHGISGNVAAWMGQVRIQRGGQGVRTPPGKSQVRWVSIGNKQLDPPGK